MAKKKSSKAAPVKTRVKNAKAPTVENGIAEHLGYGAGAGFPWNQGAPGTEQLSSAGTIFKNLRYYFVSNFRQILSQSYVELGLVQTICDVPVDDALRGGVDVTSKQLDEDQLVDLQNAIERDDDLQVLGQAGKWNRLFGGAGVLIITDQDPATPLDLEAIDADSSFKFHAVDMWELFWDMQNTEGFDPIIASEETEFFDYYGEKVHKSRVLIMKGLTAPSFLRPRLRGWGFSVVEILVRSINQYLKATDLSFEVLDEFKLDIYKIKNLVNTLMSPQGDQAVAARIQKGNWMKNYQNALVMDSEDDYDHKQLSFTGLSEVMAGIRMQVASDMRMPLTKLFGISAAGFNSGEDDIEVYNAMVEGQVRNKIKHPLLRMVEIKCQRLFGFIPDDLKISFKPLREMTSEQEENVKTQKFNRVAQARAAGEITTFEFREACNKDELLPITLDTTADTLNPDDPEIDSLVEGGSKAGQESQDGEGLDGEGANAMDSQASKLPKKASKDAEPKTPKGGKKPPQVRNTGNPYYSRIHALEIKGDTTSPIYRNFLRNSIDYDKAAFEVDGGDSQFDPARLPFYEKLADVNPSLWSRAEEASMKAYGKFRWQFAVWFYKQNGGKFHESQSHLSV